MKKGLVESIVVSEALSEQRMSDIKAGTFGTILSRKGFKKAIKNGLVHLNGAEARTGDYVNTGDLIEIYHDENPTSKPSIELQLNVLFEDDHLAVVYKPAGIVVSGNKKFTLENALGFNLNRSSREDALPRPEPVHRLDYPTSGCLLVAKCSETLLALNQMFVSKKINKTYHAVCIGNLPASGKVSSPIDSKISETDFTRLEQMESNKYSFLNLVELKPKTGRKHQLRKHLAQMDCPIFGDKVYGKKGLTGQGSGLYLHASKLSFVHPISGTTIKVLAQPPKKFNQLFPNFNIE